MDGWNLHIFYVNPEDPRIIVPKATGLGFTLNFGHPVSWAIAAAVILSLIAIAVLCRRNRA